MPDLEFYPLTPDLMEDLGTVLQGSWGAGCWCMYPRLRDPQMRQLGGKGSMNQRRRRAMEQVAFGPRAPGLLAYREGQPAGWIAVAPRSELSRVDASRATPPFDDLEVWVIPCITVSTSVRGQGVALGLIAAAVDFALHQGAPAVEAYPRAGKGRVKDNNAYFGTEALFQKAGFKVVRKPLVNLPKNWVARVTMRYQGR